MNKYENGRYSANKLILEELKLLGYEYKKIENYILAFKGDERYVFNGTETSNTSLLASRIVKNKYVTSLFLKNDNISVPVGKLFKEDEYVEAKEFANKLIDFVVKPVDGNKGLGVSVGPEIIHFDSCWKLALKNSNKGVLIEKRFLKGEEARYVVVNGDCIGVVMRKPPEVLGDGVSTLEQLVQYKNKFREQNPGLSNRPIILDEHRVNYIKKQGYNIDSVIPDNLTIYIDSKAGLSTGGEPHEIFEDADPYLKSIAESVAKSIPGLDIAGIDIIANNHFKNNNSESYVVIEVNTKPGIAGHHFPIVGKPTNIAREIVRSTIKFSVDDKNVNGLKSKEKINKLPLYKGECQVFEHDISQKYSRLLGRKAILLRRTFWQKGLVINSWVNSKNQGLWSVIGVDRAIKFRLGMPYLTSSKTRKITNSKFSTKDYLAKNGIRVPSGIVIDKENTEEALKWFRNLLVKKAVVKPLSGSGGKGVTVGLTNESSLIDSINLVTKSKVVLEEHVEGSDYRILVVGGKFVAAIKRIPAHVVGDGVTSIRKLVANKNKERFKNPYSRMYPINLNDEVKNKLATEGVKLDSIPDNGQKIYFQSIANIGAGGDSQDVTDSIHSDYKAIAEQCWHSFPDLAFCGIDLLASDITVKANNTNHAVIEVNANCDTPMHHFPTYGTPRNVTKVIADYLFPNDVKVSLVNKTVVFQTETVNFINKLSKYSMVYGIAGRAKVKDEKYYEVEFEGSCAAVDSIIANCIKQEDIFLIDIKNDVFKNYSSFETF